jgi:hypothetical protein
MVNIKEVDGEQEQSRRGRVEGPALVFEIGQIRVETEDSI